MQTNTKTSLIAGAIILLLFTCFLIDLAVLTAGNATAFEPPLVSDPALWNLLGLLAVLSTLSIIVLAAWLISRGNATIQHLSDMFTIKATIPGYFLVALFPIGTGISVMLLTRRMEMGCLVTLLSIPSILLFLVIALRKTKSL